jgi:DnaK suppressor protein
MNISELKKRLREKKQELWADMTRTEAEARSLGEGDIQNSVDSSEGKENVFQRTTSDWLVFTQIRDALERIEAGTYGKCVDCGRQIEDDRLESVPWTPYCLKDQGRHEHEAAEQPL